MLSCAWSWSPLPITPTHARPADCPDSNNQIALLLPADKVPVPYSSAPGVAGMPHYPRVALDNRPIRPQTHQSRPGYAAPIKQGFTMAGIWCRRRSGRNVTTAHDLSPISAALAAYELSITHRNGSGVS